MTDIQEKAADIVIEAIHHCDEDPDAADNFYNEMENFFRENPADDHAAFLAGIPLAVVWDSNPDVDQSAPFVCLMNDGWQDRAREAVMESWNNCDYGDETDAEIDALENELERTDISDGASFDGPMGFSVIIETTNALDLIKEFPDLSFPEREDMEDGEETGARP